MIHWFKNQRGRQRREAVRPAANAAVKMHHRGFFAKLGSSRLLQVRLGFGRVLVSPMQQCAYRHFKYMISLALQCRGSQSLSWCRQAYVTATVQAARNPAA